MKILKTTGLAIALAMLGTACSSAPSATDEASGETHEAICGNGTRPGCGACVADPSSPTGASRTCFTCDDSYQQQCRLPPTLVPTNPTAYADPSIVSAQQDASTVHYSVGVPNGCVLQGSMIGYQNGQVWLQSSELDPPGNGQGWETFPNLDQTTLIILQFWCRGYESNKVPVGVTITYR